MTDTSAHLLFFALELNRIDDAVIEDSLSRDPRAAHYTPWIHDLRLDRPYQLDDRIEQLFHEKIHDRSRRLEPAFRRDHGWIGIHNRRRSAASRAHAVHAAAFRWGAAQEGRPGTRGDVQGKPAHLHPDHQTRSPRTRKFPTAGAGFEDIADSRHLANRVERPVVDALAQAVREACPRLSHRYYAMKARWLGLEKLEFLGPQRALARYAEPDHLLG